jgi:hypothetical protein
VTPLGASGEHPSTCPGLPEGAPHRLPVHTPAQEEPPQEELQQEWALLSEALAPSGTAGSAAAAAAPRLPFPL